MSAFEKFMAMIAERRENQKKENPQLKMGGVKTADGVEFSEAKVESVRMVVAGCTEDLMLREGKVELFTRLTVNLIKSNTADDLNRLMSHHFALKMVDILFR